MAVFALATKSMAFINLFVYCEFLSEPASLYPSTFQFQFTKLLCDVAEPGSRFPLMDSAMTEKDVLSILLSEPNCVVSGWERFGNVKLTYNGNVVGCKCMVESGGVKEAVTL